MKYLSITNKLKKQLSDIEYDITYAKNRLVVAYKRSRRKKVFGFLSLISEDQCDLAYECKKCQNKLEILEDYRDSISQRLNRYLYEI